MGYDYSKNGAYFITICTKDRSEIFGTIGTDIIRPLCNHTQLTEIGIIVENGIRNIGDI